MMAPNDALCAQDWVGPDLLHAALANDPCRDVISHCFDLTVREARYLFFHDADSIAFKTVRFTKRYQVGIWLRPDLRGPGLAKAWLCQSLADMPKGPVFAIIENTNTASLSIFTACGFRPLSSRQKNRAEIVFFRQVH